MKQCDVVFLQTAESVAESVMNLATADSVVMVTVDSAEALSSQDQSVVIHESAETVEGRSPTPGDVTPPTVSLLDPTSALSDTPLGQDDSSPGSHSPSPRSQGSATDALGLQGAEGGIEEEADKDVFHPDLVMGNRSSRLGNRKIREPLHARQNPSNPMSVSVPNLTSSMEQTVSLLESFAAVARRNLGNSANNMARSANASSLVRLALSSNTPATLDNTLSE